MKLPVFHDEPMPSPKLSPEAYLRFLESSWKMAAKKNLKDDMVDMPMFSLNKNHLKNATGRRF